MKRLTLISLQKTGGAALDVIEFSNALCKEKIVHNLVISSGNELIEHFVPDPARTFIKVPTFASNTASFLFWTVTLIRPVYLLVILLRVQSSYYLSTHFHPWLFMVHLASRITGRPWMYAIHESPFWEKESRGDISTTLEKKYLRQADTVFCYSHFIAQNLKGNLPGKKIIALPLGAYTEGYNIAKKHPALIPVKKHPRILYVGRIEAHKGLETLIESASQLASGKQPFELLIAGRGTLPESALTKPYIIVYNKWLSIEEFGALTQSADIIVLPYNSASQSGIIAWANAVGRPTVITNVGGLPEQIIDNVTGFCVPSRDPAAITEKLDLLLSNENKRKVMAEAAKELGKKLSWQEVARLVTEES